MLDASIRAGLLNLMLRLREEEDLSYLFITHDLAMARYLCDEIGVMYLGKMVEKGRTEEVVQSPAHPYTTALLSAVPIPDPQMRRERMVLPGEIPHPANPPSGCPFHPRCRYAKKECREMEPELKDLGDNHLTACHL